MKAVKSDPDPAWGSVAHKVMFFHTGSDLTAFLFFTPCYAAEVYRVLSWHEGSVGSRKA